MASGSNFHQFVIVDTIPRTGQQLRCHACEHCLSATQPACVHMFKHQLYMSATASEATLSANVLWTASEVGSTDDRARWIRFIAIDLNNKTTLEQYVYEKESDAGNGVVSIIALDYDGTLLVMERVANGNDYSTDHLVRLYFAYCDKTLNIQGSTRRNGVKNTENFLKKEELLELSNLAPYKGQPSNNVGRFESMTPRSLDKNSARIVMASNNGFQENVTTQILTVELDIDLIGVVEPTAETDAITGDPDDRAINAQAWINPNDSRDSLIFGTAGSGSILWQVMNLQRSNTVTPPSTMTLTCSMASYFTITMLWMPFTL